MWHTCLKVDLLPRHPARSELQWRQVGKAIIKEVPSKRRKTKEAAPSADEIKGYHLYINSYWYRIHHKQDQICQQKTHPLT